MKKWYFSLLLSIGMMVLLGCAREELPPPPTRTPSPVLPTAEPTSSLPTPLPSPTPVDPNRVVQYTVDVLSVYPHDPQAFTQGLQWQDGVLYESTGLYGFSSVRHVDLASGEVQRQIDLDPALFGEGLTLVDERLLLITWKEQVALEFDRETLAETGRFSYEGEGWGICYDGEVLWMSNGSDRLTRRDPITFEPLGEVQVTERGQSIIRLNELECVDGRVLANVWFTDQIKVIDPDTGFVIGNIDLFGLLTEEERAGLESGSVLNGIAYDPQKDVFYVTGKRWPKLFEVQFRETNNQ